MVNFVIFFRETIEMIGSGVFPVENIHFQECFQFESRSTYTESLIPGQLEKKPIQSFPQEELSNLPCFYV